MTDKTPQRDWSKTAFRLSFVVVVFLFGTAVGRYRIFPYSVLKFGQDSVQQVYQERNMLAKTRPDYFLNKAHYPGSGVVTSRADRAEPGFTFMTGFFNGGNELRLIRLDGSEIHRWPVAYSKIFHDTSFIKPDFWVPATDWNIDVHGALALPDGSVVFNFDARGLVKLDRCGNVQWTLPMMTHHSLEFAEDGGFWVLGKRYYGDEDQSPFPLIKPPVYDELLWKVSTDGKLVSEISFLKLLFDNNLHGAILFANGMDGIDLAKNPRLDTGEYTHLNDLEELNSKMARQFPQFSAGDLLLSERQYNLIMVLDPKTQKVKWHQRGPWIGQHDPDFESNGRISVFNNNNDSTPTGTLLGGTTIVEVDPLRGEVFRKYGGVANQKMFTPGHGKHQYLENGNILITEGEAGRVLEIDARGEIVWEFINRYDSDYIALVTQAIRYPESYFGVRDWACH